MTPAEKHGRHRRVPKHVMHSMWISLLVFFVQYVQETVMRAVCKLRAKRVLFPCNSLAHDGGRQSKRHYALHLPAPQSDHSVLPIRWKQQGSPVSFFFFVKSAISVIRFSDYITGDLVNFARSNPEVLIDCTPFPNRHPALAAQFLNGRQISIGVKNLSAQEVATFMGRLRGVSGYQVRGFQKWTMTAKTSIQGNWTPFTNLGK